MGWSYHRQNGMWSASVQSIVYGVMKLSVSICIDGQPIYARTAVDQGEQPSGFTKYLLDDGSTVLHKPEYGEVALAIQLLKTIKEQDVSRKVV